MIEYNLARGAILAAAFVATFATLWFTKRRLAREDIAYTLLGTIIGFTVGVLVLIWWQ